MVLKFKGYCAENSISQKEVAEVLGISIVRVNRKMNGKEAFTLRQIKTLCLHYGISADEYFI